MLKKRLSYLSVRVTDAEKGKLDQSAREQRLSLSQLIRKSLKLERTRQKLPLGVADNDPLESDQVS